MDDFTGKVVLITGAGHGIGREMAEAFSSAGVAVAANDINPINLEETVSQVLQSGGTAAAFVFDVAKRMPVEAMLSQVMDHFGRIDFLVNCASVEPDASILDMDEWEFHRTLDVNLGGPFFCIQQTGRVMRQQGGGAIINIVSARARQSVSKGEAAYLASQAGLIGLTHAAGRELSIYNIRLNAVCLGLIDLDFVSVPAKSVPAFRKWQESHPPLTAFGHPNLAGLVLFLCSQTGSSLTGQVLMVEPG